VDWRVPYLAVHKSPQAAIASCAVASAAPLGQRVDQNILLQGPQCMPCKEDHARRSNSFHVHDSMFAAPVSAATRASPTADTRHWVILALELCFKGG
jgi:hypothetical protein